MRQALSLIALALLLATPGQTVSAQEVDLRGPAPKAGDAYRVTVETESEEGKVEMNIGGQPIQGRMENDSNYEIEMSILEVEGEDPTKVRTKFIKASSVTKMNIMGQQQNQEDTNMQGVVLTQTKTDGKWQSTMEGGMLPPEAKDLVKDAGFMDPRLAFPDQPVAVGKKWTIKDQMLKAFTGQAGMPGSELEGEATFELVALKEVDGRQTAVIDYEMDVTIIMNMSPQPGVSMTMNIKMDGKGNLHRDLTDYTSQQTFNGDMGMNMTVTQGGNQAMNMTAEMPIKTRTVQKLKE